MNWFKKVMFGLVLALSISGAAAAAETKFQWDYDGEADPSVVGFKLYRGATGAVRPIGSLVGKTMVLDVTDATKREAIFTWETPLLQGTYYFVLTAYDAAGNESEPSNEVSKVNDTFPPASPTGLRIVE